jgi:hypothetical protein
MSYWPQWVAKVMQRPVLVTRQARSLPDTPHVSFLFRNHSKITLKEHLFFPFCLLLNKEYICSCHFTSTPDTIINQLWLSFNRRYSYITGCVSCMRLTVTINTIAECLRTDCNILGDNKKNDLFWQSTTYLVTLVAEKVTGRKSSNIFRQIMFTCHLSLPHQSACHLSHQSLRWTDRWCPVRR